MRFLIWWVGCWVISTVTKWASWSRLPTFHLTRLRFLDWLHFYLNRLSINFSNQTNFTITQPTLIIIIHLPIQHISLPLSKVSEVLYSSLPQWLESWYPAFKSLDPRTASLINQSQSPLLSHPPAPTKLDQTLVDDQGRIKEPNLLALLTVLKKSSDPLNKDPVRPLLHQISFSQSDYQLIRTHHPTLLSSLPTAALHALIQHTLKARLDDFSTCLI